MNRKQIEFIMKKQFKNVVFRTGLFIMATISLVACGNTDNSKESKAESGDVVTEEVQEVAEVETAPANDLSFKDKNGDVVSLSSLKGKVVFINFWATWCPPCIHELPSINELRKTFKDDIEFVMVDVDNKIEQATAFMEENKYDLPVYTPASNIPSDYLGGAIPTTVILDKNGKMVSRIEGGRDYSAPEIVQGLTQLVESH
ncbi:TlpA disulfide reductase family protein [Olivibacter sp. SDN3]|uniref:TlpA family protein disulfide reductase n=1 Tax=Olivibacter sp. SDN3 TaxID=2764720 RepID=UPI002101E2A2|nr:TlpA disulfide reductase family protein [Olivibacter sp. SDN3]